MPKVAARGDLAGTAGYGSKRTGVCSRTGLAGAIFTAAPGDVDVVCFPRPKRRRSYGDDADIKGEEGSARGKLRSYRKWPRQIPADERGGGRVSVRMPLRGFQPRTRPTLYEGSPWIPHCSSCSTADLTPSLTGSNSRRMACCRGAMVLESRAADPRDTRGWSSLIFDTLSGDPVLYCFASQGSTPVATDEKGRGGAYVGAGEGPNNRRTMWQDRPVITEPTSSKGFGVERAFPFSLMSRCFRGWTCTVRPRVAMSEQGDTTLKSLNDVTGTHVIGGFAALCGAEASVGRSRVDEPREGAPL